MSSLKQPTLMKELVVLGTAVPDFISHSRTSVCTAGYSEEYGLVRIYPVPTNSEMRRWNIVNVEVEGNSSDTREESWKIRDSRIGWNRINSKIHLVGSLKKSQRSKLLEKLVTKYGVGCIKELNRKKRSLGFIVPSVRGYRMVDRENYEPNDQRTLYGTTSYLT